jgi:hypothetical protein
MPSSYDYNEQFKDRLKSLPFLAVLFLIVFFVNMGIWTFDKYIVMYMFAAFVSLKFFAIALRCLQLWIRDGKKFVLLLLFSFILLSAFIFDFEIIPNLLAYGSGIETQGSVVESFVTDIKKSHFIVYEFSVDNEIFKKQQLVSASFFQTVQPGSIVSINYLRQNPKVSFLTDLNRLKFGTAGTLFLGFGIFASLYTNEIEDKINLIIKRRSISQKTA